jgi:tetratricopeptide (TPR) repeat protein
VIYKIIHEEPLASTEIRNALPEGFETIISKALAKDPKKRYQTCEQLQQDLQGHAETTQKPPKRTSRRWIGISIAVGSLFIIGAVLVLFLNQKIHLPFLGTEKSIEITAESPLPPPIHINEFIEVPDNTEKQMTLSFENKDYSKTKELAEKILSTQPGHKTALRYLEQAQDELQNLSNKAKASPYLNTGINHYKQGSYKKCIDDMNQVLKWDQENKEAKKYIYLADTALSQIEIKNILERQKKAEEEKNLDNILADIGSENFLEQRKADLSLLFEHYKDIQSIYSDINIQFKNTREAKVDFSHMLIAVYKKTNQRKVLFEGTKTWTVKKTRDQWKIIDNE